VDNSGVLELTLPVLSFGQASMDPRPWPRLVFRARPARERRRRAWRRVQRAPPERFLLPPPRLAPLAPKGTTAGPVRRRAWRAPAAVSAPRTARPTALLAVAENIPKRPPIRVPRVLRARTLVLKLLRAPIVQRANLRRPPRRPTAIRAPLVGQVKLGRARPLSRATPFCHLSALLFKKLPRVCS